MGLRCITVLSGLIAFVAGQSCARTNDATAQPTNSMTECGTIGDLSAQLSIDKDVIIFQLHNTSRTDVLEILGDGRSNPISISITDGDVVLTQTEMSKDGWWNTLFYSSTLYAIGHEPRTAIEPDGSRVFSKRLDESMWRLQDYSPRFDRSRLSQYTFKAKAFVSTPDGRRLSCESEVFEYPSH